MAIPPAGLTPAGFFVPETFAAPSLAAGFLADAVDPETGEYLSISRGIDPIDSQVLTALTLLRGSGAATMDDGQEFTRIPKVDDTTAALVDAEARRALARLVANGDIAVRKIYSNTSPDADWAEVAVDFENRRAVKSPRRLAKVRP